VSRRLFAGNTSARGRAVRNPEGPVFLRRARPQRSPTIPSAHLTIQFAPRNALRLWWSISATFALSEAHRYVENRGRRSLLQACRIVAAALPQERRKAISASSADGRVRPAASDGAPQTITVPSPREEPATAGAADTGPVNQASDQCCRRIPTPSISRRRHAAATYLSATH